MREQSSARLYNEENSIDNQNNDENFSVLTAQGVNFFRFCSQQASMTLILTAQQSQYQAGSAPTILGQYMMIATPTKLTAPPIKSS